jgi:hypothetical protein
MARSTLVAAIPGAAAVVVAVVLVAVHLLASPGSPAAARREHDAATKWIDDVQQAFGPGLTETVTAMLAGAPQWEQGTLSSADFGGRVGPALVQLLGARSRMVAITPFAPSPLVKDLTVRSTELSVEVARVYTAALALPPGDLRRQADLEGRRLQQLASRVFDRAQAVLEPYLHQPSPDQVVQPADVPSWAAAGLSPGPPLDGAATASPATGPPPTRRPSAPCRYPGATRLRVSCRPATSRDCAGRRHPSNRPPIPSGPSRIRPGRAAGRRAPASACSC